MSVFVDTGAWYASIVPTDPHHAATIHWLRHNPRPIVTSDYVIDETLTLLRVRGEADRAIAIGRHFFDLGALQVHFLSQDEIIEAWQLFRDNPRREWSFTDCTTRIVMGRRHLKEALAFDHHLAELGITLLP